MKKNIQILRKKFEKYKIDGYVVPKNDEYFTEYSKINRLQIISNFSGSAGLAIILKKEILLVIIAGVFVVEALSVMLQVGFFKYSKKKYGKGKRLFLMAPLHHHFELKGIHESKIVIRFWIIGVLLALLSIITLKVQ